MKKKTKTFWRLIAKSLGEKSGKDDKEADKIAIIRLLAFLSIFITNSFIIFGVLKTHIIPRDYLQTETGIYRREKMCYDSPEYIGSN